MEKVTQAELSQILAAVNDTMQALVKAEPGEETAGEKKPDGSSADAPSPDKSSPPPAKADGGEAPPAPKPEAPAPVADPVSPESSGDPAADQGEATPEMLEAEYLQLPPQELMMHFLAVKSAVMKQSAGASAAPAPMAPPASPAPAATAPDMTSPPIQKSEDLTVIFDRLSKAEESVLGLQKSNEELRKSNAEKEEELEKINKSLMETFGKIAEKLSGPKPLVKSISGVSSLPKKEEGVSPLAKMSRDQMKDKIDVLIKSSLPDRDRDLINKFVVGTKLGETEISRLENLLSQ